MFFSRNVAIGSYRAVLTLNDQGAFSATWSPAMPSSLSASELHAYCAARDRLISEMREALHRNGCLLKAYSQSTWHDDDVG